MTIIERAFQLAESSMCSSIADIRRELRREGYDRVDEHLNGRSLQKQLQAQLADNGRKSNPLYTGIQE